MARRVLACMMGEWAEYLVQSALQQMYLSARARPWWDRRPTLSR